jgi:hypothetical protein
MPSTQTQSHYDVFLSHQSGDKPQVEQLAVRLEDEGGLKPFLDKWHLVPGAPWQEELEAALDRSATCAVFLGASGLGAWENEEMRMALDERVRNSNFRVIPVLLPGAKPKDENTLPRFLRRLAWVDFRGGLDDAATFQRLVAGIRGVAPGRQAGGVATPINQPPHSFWQTLTERFASKGERRAELWKIILPVLLALLLSVPFISAAIPRYKLQVKSPAFHKDGIYEASAGIVSIKWVMTKEQWFREIDINDINTNVTIRKLDDGKEMRYQNQLGGIMRSLGPGKYEIRIDAADYRRSETIALQVTPSASPLPTPTKTPPPPTPTPIVIPPRREIEDWVSDAYPKGTVFGHIEPRGKPVCTGDKCRLQVDVNLIDSSEKVSSDTVTVVYRAANGGWRLVEARRN